MTFNDDARVGRTRVRRRTGGAIAGVGGGTLLVLFLLSQVLNVDLTGLAGGGGGEAGTASTVEGCTTGADANRDVDCRMVFAYESVDTYWSGAASEIGVDYVSPDMTIFTGSVGTGCGQATSAVGPFYCPPDQGVYLDTGFFETLTTQLGADGGPLAEMYVVAHEMGHHVQNLSGTMDRIDREGSGPASDGVRLELQADCFAGAWAADATTTLDDEGRPFLEPFTDDQLATALDAAAAVGDDRIQSSQGGAVNPETWTHGSAQSRQRWFTTGYEGGPTACDTFAVAGDRL